MPSVSFQPSDLISIADQFVHQGQITELQPFGNGNINDTFLVSLENQEQTSDSQQTRFVLQRINTQVFRQPEWVMGNMSIYCAHVRERLQHHPLERRWEVPHVIFTRSDQDYWQDQEGNFWRAISFIEGSESFDTLHDVNHAREIGYALGMFHTLVSDLPPEKLADTLMGYHITPQYLQHYHQVLEQVLTTSALQISGQASGQTSSQTLIPEVKHCLEFIQTRQGWATVLEDAKASGKLPLRLMHGDPKVNNVMFDRATGQAVSVIDLDTVKPGLVHYDIGDCLRSGCNPAGEETQAWEAVRFDLDLCQALLQGYGSVAHTFLTENDYAYLFDAIRLIAFELGLRFFTDYLAGSVYFKVKYPEHNLHRALVQFQLTASIEAQKASIQALVNDLTRV
jgi:Ser/Thr protein kinase RdoA (MazF antagonist)